MIAVFIVGVIANQSTTTHLSTQPASKSFINSEVNKLSSSASSKKEELQRIYGINQSAQNSSEQQIDLKSTELAAAVSEDSDLIVASNVVNYKETLEAQATVAPIRSGVVEKIDTGQADETTHNVVEYTTVEGDSVPSLAIKFNISADTIRWANGINSDLVAAGTKLKILPVSGVLATVEEGDTIDKIAQKYTATVEDVLIFNDISLEAGVGVGTQLIIPNGVPPAAPVDTSSSRSSSNRSSRPAQSSDYTGPPAALNTSGSNTYSRGYCTWWAAQRRIQIGRPIPNRMGNAISWASRARSSGYSVDSSPRAGDVLHHKYMGGYGHVAFVEKANADGSVTISEMNYRGWNRVSYRTISPAEFSQYNFIH